MIIISIPKTKKNNFTIEQMMYEFIYNIQIFASNTRDQSIWKNCTNPVNDCDKVEVKILKKFRAHKESVTYIRKLKITENITYLSCGNE